MNLNGDGGFTVAVPALTGYVFESGSGEKALNNIKVAIEVRVEVLKEDG